MVKAMLLMTTYSCSMGILLPSWRSCFLYLPVSIGVTYDEWGVVLQETCLSGESDTPEGDSGST